MNYRNLYAGGLLLGALGTGCSTASASVPVGEKVPGKIELLGKLLQSSSNVLAFTANDILRRKLDRRASTEDLLSILSENSSNVIHGSEINAAQITINSLVGNVTEFSAPSVGDIKW